MTNLLDHIPQTPLLERIQDWVVWMDNAFGLWLLSHQQSIVATQR